MQNSNVKYLKMSDGFFSVFYRENNILFFKTNLNRGWSSPQVLAERAGSAFSVSQYAQVCYVLYSSLEGNLYILSSKDFVNWERKSLPGSIVNASRFFLVPDEKTLHLIYSLPTETRGIESLVYMAFIQGRWEKPYYIDRFIPFGKTAFLSRRLRKEHIILYYRTARNVWSAREMLLSPFTMGSLTPMLQAPANFADISIVNDTERIHFLYTIRNMFRTQVVYQYKQATAMSTPRVLWEDSNCDNCLAFLENEKLVLMWTANGQPLRCISENNGAAFGVVERYTGAFPVRCTKGELCGAENIALNATETYGDLSRKFQPFLLVKDAPAKPYFQALPFEREVEPMPRIQEKQPRPTQEIWPKPVYSPQENRPQPPRFTQENQDEFPREMPPQPTSFEEDLWQQPLWASSEIHPLQNTQMPSDEELFQQPFSYQKEPPAAGQTQQLEELTALLAQRSDEISAVNAKWKTQISRLESELDTLRAENKHLKHSLNTHATEKPQPPANSVPQEKPQEASKMQEAPEPLAAAETTLPPHEAEAQVEDPMDGSIESEYL